MHLLGELGLLLLLHTTFSFVPLHLLNLLLLLVKLLPRAGREALVKQLLKNFERRMLTRVPLTTWLCMHPLDECCGFFLLANISLVFVLVSFGLLSVS